MQDDLIHDVVRSSTAIKMKMICDWEWLNRQLSSMFIKRHHCFVNAFSL